MNSRTKIFLVLALALVFCFVLAGMAVAAPAMTVNADGYDYSCAEKENVSYTFDITGINIVAACFTDPSQPSTIVITLPAGFSFTAAQIAGLSLPVKLYVTEDNQWYFAQPTPVISGSTATITIPMLPIADANNKHVTQIKIGDDKQDLRLINPCVEVDTSKEFDVWINTKCPPSVNVKGSILIKEAPKTVIITEISSPQVACSAITVKGRVYKCNDKDWACKPVKVYITKPDCKTVLIGPVNATTDGFGWFGTNPEVSINTPDCAGEYRVLVVAETPCGDVVSACEPITVVAKPPAKLQWYKHNPAVPGEWEPICDTTQLFKACNRLKVELRDSCPCPNPCNDGNMAVAGQGGVKVDLTGIVQGSSPQIVGVHFFANENDCNTDTPQINSVTIAQGTSSVEVWAKPIVDGNVVIEGRNPGLTPDSFVAHVGISVINQVYLELKTKLVQDLTRAGWPVQGSVWLDPDWCAACGSDNFTVMVEFQKVVPTDPKGKLTVTWDTYLKTDYLSTGANGSGATYLHKNAQAPGNPCKSHFYIYTTDFKIPDGCEPNTPIGSLEVRVKVTCDTTQVTYVTNWQSLELVTPVELKRSLAADTWQVLSTPKYLAGASGADGNLADLLGNNFSVAYCYLNGVWYNITNQSVKPLQAYYVKTKQRAKYEDDDYYTANYIYKRYTQPSQTIPRVIDLAAGWNNVGVSEPAEEIVEIVPDLCIQPEYVNRYVAPLCKLCKKIVNPKLGNIAEFQVLGIGDDGLEGDVAYGWYEESIYVFNGDAYWLWVDGAGKLVAEALPPLIDP